MPSTNDDLALRIERLERDFRRLATAAAGEQRVDLVDRLTFLGWLKISGPTFAVMVFGFGLLWQAQQELSRATSEQIAELRRATSEQIAATNEQIAKTNAQIADLGRSMNQQFIELNRTVGRLEGAIGGLQTQIAQLGASIDKLSERAGRL